jgi:uncharacterized protein (DUF342 family)
VSSDDDSRPANADAKFRFCMTKSGMKVGISQALPHQGSGRPFSVELMREQLHQAGIKRPLDENAAREALDKLSRGEDVRTLVLARGLHPSEPADASITLLVDCQRPVTPRTPLGKLVQAREGRAGETADGRPVPSSNPGIPRRITVGQNIRHDLADDSLMAEVYGMLRLSDTSVSVEPLVKVAPDRFSVTAELHAQSASNTPITTAMLEEELKRLGVVVPLRTAVVEAALKQAAASKAPQTALIVEGSTPVDGEDGRLEMLVKTRTAGPTENEGRIDYRERGTFPSVEPGMVVAELRPPTKGLPGMDVFGKPYPAREGKAIEVAVGEGIEASPDGTKFKATQAGMLVIDKSALMVTEYLEVKGNVDYATGNIRADRGSVKIRGSVSSGFTVTAPGHIVVGEVIESATVEAGGDVSVRGGLLMPGGGVVKAGGSVTAQYAANAHIVAGADVLVSNEITNSQVLAQGRVIAAKGKGIIQGGEIVCGAGVQANELGSELAAPTSIVISVKTAENLPLIKEKKELRSRVRKIYEALGKEDPRSILEKTPEPKRKAVAEILRYRIQAEARMKAINVILEEELRQRLKALEAAQVVVMNVAYPGVSIKFGGRVLTLAEPVKRSRFRWDGRGSGIVVESL